MGVSLTPRVTKASRSRRPIQPEPGQDTWRAREHGDARQARPASRRTVASEVRVEHAAAGLVDHRLQLASVATTSLISRGSSTPALATAVSSPEGPSVSTLLKPRNLHIDS